MRECIECNGTGQINPQGYRDNAAPLKSPVKPPRMLHTMWNSMLAFFGDIPRHIKALLAFFGDIPRHIKVLAVLLSLPFVLFLPALICSSKPTEQGYVIVEYGVNEANTNRCFISHDDPASETAHQYSTTNRASWLAISDRSDKENIIRVAKLLGANADCVELPSQ
jgi:hypothetical protein